jgi:hypothetical protein
MTSKRKSKQWKRQEVAKECLQKVFSAIQSLGGDVTRFFQYAARELKLSRERVQRAVAKFKRVLADGLDRHRGYKPPEWALAFAEKGHLQMTQCPVPT